ncbi:MAG: DUF4153 domain-containing protein, partial [Deltaproteobacteria bacterium]|nr:DUF4153 domain-containing protein [Deltaproteobacteria bacterium]
YELAKYWKIRLDSDKIPDKIRKINLSDIYVMIIACLTAGFLIKIPDLFNFSLTDTLFYEKNAGIIVFLGLTIFIIGINKIKESGILALILISFMIPAIYINLLPGLRESSSINLAYIHLPLLMWCIYGLVFIDFNLKDKTRRIEFLRYNGDLAILTAIILIAGGILTGITIGLFEAIEIQVENFYMENIVIVGLVSVPVVATFIIKNYPEMTNKIAPIIASFFSPLVLLSAIVYLIALIISGKDPYNDRDFLLIFNIMLLGVMAVIVFSISGTSVSSRQKFSEMVLFILALVSVVIDLIALSAIFYRLGTFGITPNRLAVLGSNILILGNLILIAKDLFKVNFKESNIKDVELTISKYLPLYIIWVFLVIFGFPLIFGMR